MSQVSKHILPKAKLDKIFSLLCDLLVDVTDKQEAEGIFSELLTPTENIMLAKRIACYYLIYKKVPNNQIADILKMSTSTVSYLKYVFTDSPTLQEFLSIKINQEKVKHFLEDLLVEVMYGSLRKGSNWSMNRKIYHEHQRKRQEPI